MSLIIWKMMKACERERHEGDEMGMSQLSGLRDYLRSFCLVIVLQLDM